MHARSLALLAPLLLASSTGAGTDAGPQDPLSVVFPLLGRWAAEPDPRAPGVTGWTAFSRERGDKVVVRKNQGREARIGAR